MEKYKEKLHAPKARLLFVDDTEMNLDVIKGLLKNTGIKVDTVLSGRQALEAVKENKYDILFIDHRMPEMDGIQTLHAMKQLPDNKSYNKPCIALTANAISGVKKMYLNEGFDDYLSKPVNPAKLEEMIRQYLPAEYIEESPDNNSNLSAENPSKENSDILEKLLSIKEISIDEALRNCGSEEVLISTIKQYYSSIDEKALELQQYFESKDWNNYGIKVHALKSTSRLVGALELSKLAEHLENSTNINDINEINNKHKFLIDSFLALKNQLKPLFDTDKKPSSKTKISKKTLSQKIKKLQEYADSFDIDGLDNIINELSKVSLPIDFSQKFDKLSQAVQNVDFKSLRNLLSEWSNKE